MRIRTHREVTATLESIALTDIILNIFIFFFTAFSLLYTFNPNRESRIDIQLPRAESELPIDPNAVIQVTLDRRGEIYLGRRAVRLEQMQEELRRAVAADPARPVIIRADKSVAFERVVRLLDAARGSGVRQLGIAIEEGAGEGIR